ncbi:MAG: hypothetical protein KDI13_07805 [Alphaproteobacteria bacterium]|nr:hypothetical protein [Alphaproteobacteria bacterium]
MVYVAGGFGLIAGFVFGQMLLFFLLRNVPKKDLLEDPYIKWKYGLLNWVIAGSTAYGAASLYQQFFP